MEAAAFKATFSDFKLVKGRKQAQFVFEVPLEQADRALECLGGVPRSDNETWVGIARLKDEAERKPESEKPKRRFEDMPLSQQCALRCQDMAFQAWLQKAKPHLWKGEQYTNPQASLDELAAGVVRQFCQVESRSELDCNDDAAARWNSLSNYFARETGRMAEQR